MPSGAASLLRRGLDVFEGEPNVHPDLLAVPAGNESADRVVLTADPQT
jgi:hypothetical protein